MKKLKYKLENRLTGNVSNYDTLRQLFDDPENGWIEVSFHTVNRIKKNTSYTNKVCIITKHDTEIVKVIPPQKIFKIKK